VDSKVIFKGNRDCIRIDRAFLGGSIANLSFGCFVASGLVMLVRQLPKR
jgi:protein dithiol:quinone oxidoreductase